MIIAGIDEAGLGPALGPLCTVGAALRVPDKSEPDSLWTLLSGICGRERKERLPIVNDSKIVYTARGIAGLELPVLAFLATREKNLAAAMSSDDQPRPEKENFRRADFLALLGENLDPADLPPWYGAEWDIPLAARREEITALARNLEKIPAVRLLALRAKIRTAKALNRDFSRDRNKAETAWQSVAALIREFANLEPRQEETLIVVDKQGGRNFYAALLGEIFNCPLIATLREGAEISEYRYRHCHFIFRPRADSAAFPVALASMLAKYLRERFMADLNAWFAERIPGLQPTAGYHGDAPRFYEAVKGVLRRNAIAVGDFWRLK